MKKLLFFIVCLFLFEGIGARNRYKAPYFKSIKLYCYFDEGRGSRFPLSQYNLLEKSETPKINLTQEEVNMINSIILNARWHKTVIVKAGMKYLYMQGEKTDNNEICLVLLNAYTLCDANNNVFFEIENENSVEWLMNLQNKYFNIQLEKDE